VCATIEKIAKHFLCKMVAVFAAFVRNKCRKIAQGDNKCGLWTEKPNCNQVKVTINCDEKPKCNNVKVK